MLFRSNVERLERDALMKIELLRPYLINNQRDSAYLQLLELGVLMEEWDADECYVRFAFDKFLEFLLAEYHWPRINDKNDLFGLCQRAGSYKILQGSTEIIIQRLCKNNQFEIFTDILDINDKYSEDNKSIIKEMCLRVL